MEKYGLGWERLKGNCSLWLEDNNETEKQNMAKNCNQTCIKWSPMGKTASYRFHRMGFKIDEKSPFYAIIDH